MTFVTLEDETGKINVVVWRATAEKYRREPLGATPLTVTGHVERVETAAVPAVHPMAGSKRNVERRRYAPTRFGSSGFLRRRNAPMPQAPKAIIANVPGSGTVLLHTAPAQAELVGGGVYPASRM